MNKTNIINNLSLMVIKCTTLYNNGDLWILLKQCICAFLCDSLPICEDEFLCFNLNILIQTMNY